MSAPPLQHAPVIDAEFARPITGHAFQRRRAGDMAKKSTKVVAKRPRLEDLKTILESRRAELLRDVQYRIRDARSDAIGDREVLDAAESSEVDVQREIGFALTQMKAETLNRIDIALRRIEEGNYGNCLECGEEISETRLRVLPFAVRCRECEATREGTDRRERSMAYRGSSAPFIDLSS